jgi:predicted nucleic acid-binding protein
MVVVSNTSPLLNLAIIERLELLRGQFETIIIPGAVFNELKVDGERPGSRSLRAAITAG